MYDLCAYFTNDGTVGLYSKDDDDIYHSTYGALSESWEKFVLPSNLKDFINANNEIKILDICYGIGYNTKAALEVFVNNSLSQNKIRKKTKINSRLTLDNAAIYADNIKTLTVKNIIKKNNKNQKKISSAKTNIEAIDSDNICGMNSGKFLTNGCCKSEISEPISNQSLCDGAVINKIECLQNSSTPRKQILIDAVDTDNTLMMLSPFFTRYCKDSLLFKKESHNSHRYNDENNFKLSQIQKLGKAKMVPLNKSFRLCQETLIIIAMEMLNKNQEFFGDKNCKSILDDNNHKPYFCKYMMNFVNFYQNEGYKHKQKPNKSTFLHNIYYRYVSKSYKNTKKILENNKIDLNFYNEDARKFVQETKNTYNFIFLDAFTPSKCPALWSENFLKQVYTKLENDGMVLTYSNSAAIRSAFIKSGFYVGKIYNENFKKFSGTIATKNKHLITHPLDESDMALINSKAGITYKDENLSFSNEVIISNRKIEVENSNLISSGKALKGTKC